MKQINKYEFYREADRMFKEDNENKYCKTCERYLHWDLCDSNLPNYCNKETKIIDCNYRKSKDLCFDGLSWKYKYNSVDEIVKKLAQDEKENKIFIVVHTTGMIFILLILGFIIFGAK